METLEQLFKNIEHDPISIPYESTKKYNKRCETITSIACKVIFETKCLNDTNLIKF